VHPTKRPTQQLAERRDRTPRRSTGDFEETGKANEHHVVCVVPKGRVMLWLVCVLGKRQKDKENPKFKQYSPSSRLAQNLLPTVDTGLATCDAIRADRT